MSAPLSPEQRATILAQLADAQPATAGLIESFASAIYQRAHHEHPSWEDFFCLNLSSYMGEHAAPVLRRLLDAEAEVERLTADLSDWSEAARERWIEKQLAETGIRAMDFRNGMEMELEPARELLAYQVAAARAMLGDAENYTETKLSWDVKVAESPETYTIVIQRHAPGALTPHEARQRAEARAAKLETALAAAGRSLSTFIFDSSDPGSDALAAQWLYQQAMPQAADDPLTEPNRYRDEVLREAAGRQRKFVDSDDYASEDWEAAHAVIDLIDPDQVAEDGAV